MTFHLVFLLEEPSMKVFLEVLLPKLIPKKIYYKCIAHEGKQDLQRSIPLKLRAFPSETQFIIIRDKDSDDCIKLKEKLVDLCRKENREDILVRIVCHELESWFLGDLTALGKAFNLKQRQIDKLQNKAKYRDPDRIAAAKQELKKIAPEYQPLSGSREIAQYIDLENNNSRSFQVFIQGIQKILDRLSNSK